MPKSNNLVSKGKNSKSDPKEIGIVSNVSHEIFKIIRFVLNPPVIVVTLGLVAILGNRMYALAAADQNGMTPLHTTANTGDLSTMQMLVNAGADIYAKNNDGHTALDLACNILENDTPVIEDSDLMCIPMEHLSSALNNHVSIVKYLTSLGARSFCTIFNPEEEELETLEETSTPSFSA